MERHPDNLATPRRHGLSHPPVCRALACGVSPPHTRDVQAGPRRCRSIARRATSRTPDRAQLTASSRIRDAVCSSSSGVSWSDTASLTADASGAWSAATARNSADPWSPRVSNSWARLRKVCPLLDPVAGALPVVEDVAVTAQRVIDAARAGSHGQQTDRSDADHKCRAGRAGSVRCRASVDPRPAPSRSSERSSRAWRSSRPSDDSRPAASSIANGTPSSRRTMSATIG